MKKALIICASILVGCFIVLRSLDHSEYRVEKRLWKIKQQFESIAQDPKVVPSKRFEEVIAEYWDIIKDYPQSKLLSRIYLQIGRVYVLQGNYAKARTVFEGMRQRFLQQRALSAEALFNIGNTYEVEEDFSNAVKTYQAVFENYPDTETGLNMPLYLANYFTRVGKKTEAQQAFEEAVKYYGNIAAQYPRSAVGYSALRSLTVCYVAQQDWSAALESLSTILLDFPTPEYLNSRNLGLLTKSINTISTVQLKDYERPVRIYETFMTRYPGHPLKSILSEEIVKLKEMKIKDNVPAVTTP